MKNYKAFRVSLVLLVIVVVTSLAPLVSADSSYQLLPFTQAWTNTNLITVNDNWSSVLGIVGYRGDNLTASTGVDPQTILADGSGTPVDVIANQINPDTLIDGGVAEFDVIADPVVALQGSGTADAPFLLLHVNATGKQGITVSYNLRDIDGGTDNTIQQVALQYRVGTSGDFTNLAAGYVADATTGPSLATLVTPVNVTLPSAADNQAQVQIRIITTNAVGSDEWVGVDDISITGGTLAVTLSSFAADAQADRVLVDWQTVSELGNAGFNLYRSTDPAGPQTLLTTLPSLAPGSTHGFAYSYEDLAVQPGQTYWYWLEDVSLSGATTLHGPASATVQAPTAVTLSGISADQTGEADTFLARLWAALLAWSAVALQPR